jgi:hypothetical protein
MLFLSWLCCWLEVFQPGDRTGSETIRAAEPPAVPLRWRNSSLKIFLERMFFHRRVTRLTLHWRRRFELWSPRQRVTGAWDGLNFFWV